MTISTLTEAQTYGYFSCYKTVNGYGRYGSTDCPTLGGGILPYGVTGAFLNPSTHQIISAGRDKTFGPGGAWVAATASDFYPPGSPGADDQANFYNRTLGIPTP